MKIWLTDGVDPADEPPTVTLLDNNDSWAGVDGTNMWWNEERTKIFSKTHWRTAYSEVSWADVLARPDVDL